MSSDYFSTFHKIERSYEDNILSIIEVYFIQEPAANTTLISI